MTSGFYNGAVVRRSLMHFMVGKGLAGAIGLSMLVLLVRMLPREEYAIYIVLTALFEMLQMGSNLGAISAAYRYIPELRSRGNAWGLLQLSRQLLTFRFATLALSAGLLLLLGSHVAGWVGMPALLPVLHVYIYVLVFEGIARFTDILFDSLLLQGFSQISVLIRNGLRITGLLAFKLGLIGFVSFNILAWSSIEAIASGIGAICSVTLYMSNVKVGPDVARPAGAVLDYPRILRCSIPLYFSPIVTLAQGADVMKVLVARVSDAIQTGSFGFATALNTMIQRYLPAFLLIGMVRPLFVSRLNPLGRMSAI